MYEPHREQRIEWPSSGPATRALLFGTSLLFLLQWLVDARTGGAFTSLFGLRCGAFARGEIWQPVTYMFLHGGVWHLGVFGRELENFFGSWRFVVLYLACGLLGGLGWMVLSCVPGAVCIGASGAVFGVIGAYAALFPSRKVTLLVMFVLPVTMSAGMLALLLGLMTVGWLVIGGGDVAHSAHLAGGLAGYFVGLSHASRAGGRRMRVASRFGRRKHGGPRILRFPAPDFRRSGEEDGAPSADEVNELLAKVLARGLDSLADDERERLREAGRNTGEPHSGSGC